MIMLNSCDHISHNKFQPLTKQKHTVDSHNRQHLMIENGFIWLQQEPIV